MGNLCVPLIGLFMAPIYPAINSVMLSSLPLHPHSTMTGLLVIFSALGSTSGPSSPAMCSTTPMGLRRFA